MKRINEDLIEISETVQIERSHQRKVAIATEELLSNDVTASHYAVGQVDANGNKIVLGQEMAYIDWLGPRNTWYVYQKIEDRFQPRGSFGGEAEAVVFALGL